MNSPDYRQQEELEQRQFEESQELLKADAENYWEWLAKLDEQRYEE